MKISPHLRPHHRLVPERILPVHNGHLQAAFAWYYLVQKWKHILLNPKAHVRARKRAIVAFSRQLLIDLWRWKTGRKAPEQMGWVMTEA